jgi:Tol biopolymer transport system component
VFEAGTEAGQQYLVTEYIDGWTLEEWVRRERPAPRQMVELMTSVADALATAHQAGILHRDIKPANILVSKAGFAKLADFGLAKVLETGNGDPDGTTLTAGATHPGTILGTVAYMSPEQAAGRRVDLRSDVFSFGVVLYEMLRGRRPFEGASDVDVLHSILHNEPRQLASVQPELRLVVEKALEKAPQDRYQSMREVVVDLRRAARAKTAEPTPAAPHLVRLRWRTTALMAAMLVVGLVVGWWLARNLEPGWHNPLEGAVFTRLTDFEGLETNAVVSRDGNFVVFLSDRDGPLDAWVLQLGSGQFLNLTKGTVPKLISTQLRGVGFSADGSHVTISTGGAKPGEAATLLVPTIGGTARRVLDGAVDPQWSPDRSRVLFFSPLQDDKDVMRVADRDGANPRDVFPVARGEHNHFMAWSPDGRYVYSQRGAGKPYEFDIWRAPAAGGKPERLTHRNAWVAHPTQLDERTLLYVASDENNAGTWLYAMDLRTRLEHRLSVGIEQYTSISAAQPAAGRRRRLVATVSNPTGSLWSIPISDSVAPESAASPFPVPSAGVSSPRLGPDYLLYLSSRELADSLWKLGNGAAIELWNARNGAVLGAAGVSRDGRQIAVAALKQGRGGLYVMTSDGANPQPLVSSLEIREAPSWSPDGKTLACTGSDGKRPGLFLVALDGTAPVRLYDRLCYLPLWSPDGRYILFAEYITGALMQLKAITPEGRPFPLPAIMLRNTSLRATSTAYRFLPDGKSLVLQEGEWRRPQFSLVSLETGARRPLTDLKPGRPTRSFDVTPDGKRIIFDRVQENSDIVLIELAER